MKRDLDLMRALVLAVEAAGVEVGPQEAAAACGDTAVDQAQTHEHVRWLIEGGYLLGVEAQAAAADGALETGSARVFGQLRLTFSGCELASLAREPKRWAKVKSVERFTGGLSLGVVVELLTHYARQDVGVAPSR